MSSWFGYNPPFMSDAGVMPFQIDERLIKNDVLQLLLTAPGERVMRPDFGTGIRKFMFELMTPDNIDALRQSIIIAMNKFEPRVALDTVNIDTNQDNNLASITIVGRLISINNSPIEITLNL